MLLLLLLLLLLRLLMLLSMPPLVLLIRFCYCRPLKARLDVAAQKIRREIMSDFKGLHPNMSRAAARVLAAGSAFMDACSRDVVLM